MARKRKKRLKVQQHPLKAWMEAEGLVQEDVARELAVDQTYISKILRGRRKPSRALASKLSKFTGRKVTVEAILGFESEFAKHRPRGATAPKPIAPAEKPALQLLPGKARA